MKNAIVKLSKLTETAVSPKPIEHQNVLMFLKVFCDETTAALKLQNECPDDTIGFLTKLVKFFKIENVKGQFEDMHTKDEIRTVLPSPNDERLNFFFSDPVEKMLGKLCQGSRGIYFINVQQVLQKVAIYKTKLCLDLSVCFNEQSLPSDHSYEKRSYFVHREVPVDVFQNLIELEQSLSKAVKMALVYIAGYVARKSPIAYDTDNYVDKYGAFLKELNRGALTFPVIVFVSGLFIPTYCFMKLTVLFAEKICTNDALMMIKESKTLKNNMVELLATLY